DRSIDGPSAPLKSDGCPSADELGPRSPRPFKQAGCDPVRPPCEIRSACETAAPSPIPAPDLVQPSATDRPPLLSAPPHPPPPPSPAGTRPRGGGPACSGPPAARRYGAGCPSGDSFAAVSFGFSLATCLPISSSVSRSATAMSFLSASMRSSQDRAGGP